MRSLSWSTNGVVPGPTVRSRGGNTVIVYVRQKGRIPFLSFILTAVLLLYLGANQFAIAYESVALHLLPADEALFGLSQGETTCEPREGEVTLVGLFNHPEFSITSISNIVLVMPGGEVVPLLIDGSSLVREFGRIVSLRFCANIPRRVLDVPETPTIIRVRWGEDILNSNRVVQGFQLNSTRSSDYMGFVWEPVSPENSESPVGELSVAVKLQRGAELHNLWHLAPLLTLLVLLGVRRAGDLEAQETGFDTHAEKR
ncbi:MAG: hypothetical protein N2255_09265 [Kiritimatiellae bacterium]|nr:hypothetical protein [Kiritimatiellia bacterium]